jgi:hypothetical protein
MTREMTPDGSEFVTEEEIIGEYVRFCSEARDKARAEGTGFKTPRLEDWKVAQGYETPTAEDLMRLQAHKVQTAPMGDGPGRRGTRYPWDLWTDGEWWEAYQGEHFFCTLSSFRAYLYSYGLDRGMRVETMRISYDPPGVAFRFLGPEHRGSA